MTPLTADFASLLDLFEVATLLVLADGVIAGANSAAQRLCQRSKEELIDQRLAQFCDDNKGLDTLIQQSLRSVAWTPGSLDLIAADGSIVRCRVHGARAGSLPAIMLRLGTREEDQALGHFRYLNAKLEELAREVGRRRRAESLLASEKRILETVAAGERLEVALTQLAHAVEAHTSAPAFASVLLLDEDRRRLHHAAAPSLPEFYRAAIDGVAIGPMVGSCGSAAFLRETVVVADIQSDPRWSGFRDLAARAGLGACWSTPIFDDALEPLGTFALYYKQPLAPLPEEIALVEDAAHVASIAIVRHRLGAERTRLLRDAQDGRAAAEHANRAKDQFIAMLGHELRNPLAAMMNAAEALAAQESEPALRERLQGVILRQGNHLRRILEDMLDVTRLDAGKLSLQRQTMSLQETLESCVDSMSPNAMARSIRLEVDTGSDPIQIDADPTRIEQIVRNLLDNAIKYGAEHGRVRVAARIEGGMAHVTIEDDGIGVDPQFLPAAFDPFSQAPQALARSGGGVGLGLPLVRRLVELHGGTVAIRSDGIGRGTTVAVALPLAGRTTAPTAPTGDETGDAPASDVDESEAILVVEDHADSREALAALLRAWGLQVTLAHDGEQGIDRACSTRFRLALIDIGLPGINGYEVARAIRESEHGRSVKLVAMTGYGQESDRQRAEEAGFDSHLVKPVTLAALRQVIPKRRG